MSFTPDTAPAEVGWGELVVLNGRKTGTRWPLSSPAVVLGQSEGSDYCLADADVSPVHCVILQTSQGTILRDLFSDGGSFVNGESVAQTVLRDGDLIGVGPFQLEFRLTTSACEPTGVPAPPLEDRQRKLLAVRDQARAALQTLRAERASYKRYVGQTTIRLNATRAQAAAEQERATVERRRLLRVHQRLKKRIAGQCLSERLALRERARQLDAWEAELQHKSRALFQGRACFNGEQELGRRKLQAAWKELTRDKCGWEARRLDQRAELEEAARQLAARAAEHQALERKSAQQRRHWDERLRALSAEAEGLENRIGNQRRRLHEIDQELRQLEAARTRLTAPPTPVPAAATLPPNVRERELRRAEADVMRRLRALEEVEADLEEQREHIALQAQALHQARQRWQHDRNAVADEWEPAVHRLEQREQDVRAREQALVVQMREQHQRHESLDGWQRQLHARQAQLDVRRGAWESERERLLADLRSDEWPGAAAPHRENYRLQWKSLCWQAQRETYERQLHALNDEVERLACVLIEEEAPPLQLRAA